MSFNKRVVVLLLFVLAAVILIVPAFIYYNSQDSNKTATPVGLDRFGINEIYETKDGGREWFVNMESPTDNYIFSKTFDVNMTKQPDGGWLIDGPAVRLNIATPPGSENWTNIEITGYAKVLSTAKGNKFNVSDVEEKDMGVYELSWRGRGARHNDDVPCEGTALIGGINIDGQTSWKKEIWHTGGYTDARQKAKITDSILGKWIGFKIVMYNLENNTAVRMESYLDNYADNRWVKVTDFTDDGGWYSKNSDRDFYAVDCGRPKDYIITNGGPIVTFRSDNIAWEFKNLSIREIRPPI